MGDKGYNSKNDEASIQTETGVELIPIHKANMVPNSWAEGQRLRAYRHGIETLNSQAEKMGIERLYARTNAGFAIKVAASVVALIFSNIHKIPAEDTGLPISWAA